MSAPDYETAIVGTGFSGLGMAIALRRAGRGSFVLLEKADALGGTWRDNHYPGCACDIPSHLYSFSFALEPSWTRRYAPQAEILAYLRRCAERFGLLPHIRFRTELTQAAFSEQDGLWRVSTSNGETFTARYLVLGLGALSRPQLPEMEGLKTFQGRVFHSAQWDHAFPLAGKRVAVVGTGASAIQFIPQLAAQVGALHVFQRTPPWVLPRGDRAISRVTRALYRAVPFLARLHRAFLYAQHEVRALGFSRWPGLMKGLAWLARRFLAKQVKDPALRQRLTPDYLPGCKRILLSDDYYPALARPNVELVTERIDRLVPEGVRTADGAVRPVDAVIFATGFRVTDLLTPLRVLGRGGVDLNEAWRARMEAFWGTAVSGFPNLFLLMGPNTGLGHNSMVFMLEAQLRYVLSSMRARDAHGEAAVDVKADAQRAFNEQLAPRLRRSVFGAGCRSWYLDRHGHNPAAWPGFTFEFWWGTRRAPLDALEWLTPVLKSNGSGNPLS